MNNKINIDEDIKIANAIVKVNKDYLKDVENQTISQREIQAIENILADRGRLEIALFMLIRNSKVLPIGLKLNIAHICE